MVYPSAYGGPDAMIIIDGGSIFLQAAGELFKCEFFQGIDVCFFTRGPFRQMRNEVAMFFDEIDVAFEVFIERLGQLHQGCLHVLGQQLACICL